MKTGVFTPQTRFQDFVCCQTVSNRKLLENLCVAYSVKTGSLITAQTYRVYLIFNNKQPHSYTYNLQVALFYSVSQSSNVSSLCV